MTAAIPTSGDGLIPRPRLMGRLDGALSVRLTSMVAGPGSGKTTLLSQWVSSRADGECVQLTQPALSALPRRLVEELRLIVPALSADLIAVLDEPGDDTRGRKRLAALAADLSRQLERHLDRDVVVVVDDFQDADREGVDFLASLARNAPSRLHLVIASRRELPFPTSRMRLTGDVITIDGAELAMDEAEVAALASVHGYDEGAAIVGEVLSRTGGWALGVGFALRHGWAERATGSEDLLAYLAEEMLATEPPPVIEFLRIAAELPWIDGELSAALGLESASLPSVRSYSTPLAGRSGALSVTTLVGDFLRSQPPVADQARLVLEAGDWYWRHHFHAEALDCWGRCGSSTAVADRLLLHGPALLARGFARSVNGLLSELAASRALPERLLLLHAEVLTTLGEWSGAAQVYEQLASPDGELSSSIAWRYGLLHHLRGDIEGALAIYRRGRAGTSPADDSALASWAASAHWLRGEREAARSLAGEALALAAASGDSRSLATAHTVLAMVAALDGDRAANDAHYRQALEHAEKAGDIAAATRIHTNRSSHFLEEGRYQSALAEIDIALRLADLSGHRIFRGVALSNRGEALGHIGRLEEAVAELRESRRTFRQLGSQLERYPLAHLGDAYLLGGDVGRARRAYEEAIALSRDSNDLQALVPALAGLSRVVAGHDPNGALALAEEAAEVPVVLGHVKAVLAIANSAFALGDRPRAQRECQRAIELARRRDDLPGLAEALLLEGRIAPEEEQGEERLGEAEAVFEELGDPIGRARVVLAMAERRPGPEGAFLAQEASGLLHRLGAKGAAREAERLARALAAKSGAQPEILTLGGFAVHVNGAPLPNSAWQSRVARELLSMLVVARGRPLHREVLIERLWPDEDPARTGNRLSVALSTIRSVLDPAREHPPDHYLVADRDSIALVLDHLRVDVEEFLAAAARGRALLRRGRRTEGLASLRAAESLYVGDFLEEAPYADWAIALREEGRGAYLDLSSILAEEALAAADYDTAARHYLRMLERDPYHEAAHLGLVRSMAAARRWGTARRLYGIYVARMGELEVEPAPFPAQDRRSSAS